MKNIILSIFVLWFSCAIIAQNSYTFETVATSDLQWTGIAISKTNRLFVNYPTWNIKSPFKVAELVKGKEVAYPSAKDNKRFVCVQSVVVDKLDRLWVLDPANPHFKDVVSSGAKLFMIDLKRNKIIREYSFPKEVAPAKSYLNDVRIDSKRKVAYITDSQLGGIIVLNLVTGKSFRALDATVTNKVLANLDFIDFQSTGKWYGKTQSDGIELSEDGKTLYFTALTGNVLYSIPTAMLRDTNKTPQERAAAITTINTQNVPTDGMIRVGRKLYMANLPQECIWQYDLVSRTGQNIIYSEKIRWADSFTVDKRGDIYFTTSQINYPKDKRGKYKIMKLTINK